MQRHGAGTGCAFPVSILPPCSACGSGQETLSIFTTCGCTVMFMCAECRRSLTVESCPMCSQPIGFGTSLDAHAVVAALSSIVERGGEALWGPRLSNRLFCTLSSVASAAPEFFQRWPEMIHKGWSPVSHVGDVSLSNPYEVAPAGSRTVTVSVEALYKAFVSSMCESVDTLVRKRPGSPHVAPEGRAAVFVSIFLGIMSKSNYGRIPVHNLRASLQPVPLDSPTLFLHALCVLFSGMCPDPSRPAPLLRDVIASMREEAQCLPRASLREAYESTRAVLEKDRRVASTPHAIAIAENRLSRVTPEMLDSYCRALQSIGVLKVVDGGSVELLYTAHAVPDETWDEVRSMSVNSGIDDVEIPPRTLDAWCSTGPVPEPTLAQRRANMLSWVHHRTGDATSAASMQVLSMYEHAAVAGRSQRYLDIVQCLAFINTLLLDAHVVLQGRGFAYSDSLQDVIRWANKAREAIRRAATRTTEREFRESLLHVRDAFLALVRPLSALSQQHCDDCVDEEQRAAVGQAARGARSLNDMLVALHIHPALSFSSLPLPRDVLFPQPSGSPLPRAAESPATGASVDGGLSPAVVARKRARSQAETQRADDAHTARLMCEDAERDMDILALIGKRTYFPFPPDAGVIGRAIDVLFREANARTARAAAECLVARRAARLDRLTMAVAEKYAHLLEQDAAMRCAHVTFASGPEPNRELFARMGRAAERILSDVRWPEDLEASKDAVVHDILLLLLHNHT